MSEKLHIVVAYADVGTGRSTAKHLLARPDRWAVVALVADPSSAVAVELRSEGASVVSQDDARALAEAFEGVYGLYLNDGRTFGDGTDADSIIAELDQLIGLASAHGAQHVVYESSVGVLSDEASGVPRLVAMATLENQVRHYNGAFTILRPALPADFFFSQDTSFAASLLRKGVGDETKVYVIANDDVGAFAQLAFKNEDNSYGGQTLPLAADALTLPEIFDLSETNGVRLIVPCFPPLSLLGYMYPHIAALALVVGSGDTEVDVQGCHETYADLMTFADYVEFQVNHGGCGIYNKDLFSILNDEQGVLYNFIEDEGAARALVRDERQLAAIGEGPAAPAGQ